MCALCKDVCSYTSGTRSHAGTVPGPCLGSMKKGTDIFLPSSLDYRAQSFLALKPSPQDKNGFSIRTSCGEERKGKVSKGGGGSPVSETLLLYGKAPGTGEDTSPATDPEFMLLPEPSMPVQPNKPFNFSKSPLPLLK